MVTTADFGKNDLFRFLNKREHPPEKVFRVASVSGEWMHCRRPMPHTDGSEQRFSFSNDYLKGAEIDIVGKGIGVEPERQPVYTKPKPKKLSMAGAWTPPVKRRGRKPKQK